MKTILLAALLGTLPLSAMAQHNEDDTTTSYCNIESPPHFPGGNEALNESIEKALKYPADALKQQVEGYVLLRFSVLTNGHIDEIEVQHSLSPSCDEEAKRILRTLPRFIPAKDLDGELTIAWLTVPVRFILPKSAKK